VESLIPGGWELLRRFSFIPAARVDDLMISYAADGGSVGPHDDLYDVFLLQGPGRRRWQIATGGDRRLDQDAAIKVLAAFQPEEEWVLEPGDMLYLPPGVAHHGVAEGPCFTYSIGFAAPSHGELIHNFLAYLGEFLGAEADGRYRDPDLRLPRRPLELGDAMIDQVAAVLGGVTWDRATVVDFLGRYFTRPKPRAAFPAPARPLDEDAFARRLSRPGRLSLALPSRGLVRRGRLFFNGEAHQVRPATMALFERLLTERTLTLPLRTGPPTRELLLDWYRSGYLTVGR
jgi:50S ribosomal protein L16 3-hydroxylase